MNLKTEIECITNRLQVLSKQKSDLETKICILKELSDKDEAELKKNIKGLWVLNKAKKTINDIIKGRIETIVTATLKSVYGEEYSFELEIDMSRNAINYIPIIVKNSFKRSIEYGSGGGVADITSFAFRIALWALNGKEQSHVFIFDEPARNIGEEDNLEKFSSMLEFLSKELDLQFIIITHKRKLALKANKIFAVENVNNNARIREFNSYETYLKTSGQRE